MWMSNTGATALMLPIAEALIEQYKGSLSNLTFDKIEDPNTQNLSMLAYFY